MLVFYPLAAFWLQMFHAPFLEIPSVKAFVLAGFIGLMFASIVSTLFHMLLLVVMAWFI